MRPEGARRVHRRAREGPPEQHVDRDREPDRQAGDRFERAAGIGGARKHDPHEEERHNGLEPECLPRADAVAGCGYAEVDRGFGERRRDQPADGARCSGGAGELCAPIGGRDRGLDTPRDEEAEGDRRIEVTAGDVAERGDHHADREPVRDRDPDQRRVADGLRGDGRAGADEDERERTDELGDGAAQDVARSLRHAAQPATAAGRIVRAHVRAHGGAVETVPRERAGERRRLIDRHRRRMGRARARRLRRGGCSPASARAAHQ